MTTDTGTPTAADREPLAMRQALALAQTPGVPTGPNPRVGAVVLDAVGDVVGTGYHRGSGTSHAEVAALGEAGPAAGGGTLIVTLEPCHHTGRTGPCSQAILDAGVRRVVFAQGDPNPVASGGAAALRAAGIEVEGGLLASQAEFVNDVWSFAMREHRPYVTWKFAATLDGRGAAADGTSQWITGPEARADVHRRRALCDAVLVGTGTVTTDDPRLTVRDDADVALPPSQQPLRVVMGEREIPVDSRVLDDTAPTLRLSTHEPADALAELFGRDRQHVWLEGGPTLAAAFVRADLVDEIVAYVAPALLGAGPSAVSDFGIGSIDAIARYRLVEVTRVGDDVRMILCRRTPEGAS